MINKRTNRRGALFIGWIWGEKCPMKFLNHKQWNRLYVTKKIIIFFSFEGITFHHHLLCLCNMTVKKQLEPVFHIRSNKFGLLLEEFKLFNYSSARRNYPSRKIPIVCKPNNRISKNQLRNSALRLIFKSTWSVEN